MNGPKKTILHPLHVKAGAQMVEFAGWEMPMQYPQGIIAEHLAVRKSAGLFDVSHMGRLVISGDDALPFLQHVLTSNAAALEPGRAQYTILPTPSGGALDDAFLYHFTAKEWLLVVNASNRQKDLAFLKEQLKNFPRADIRDESEVLAMISLQGPGSQTILQGMLTSGSLPSPGRNSLSSAQLAGVPVQLARTGYTGEPVCFELFVPAAGAVSLWEKITAAGAVPVGLGARDTLRLEAGLPLYGHELGTDPGGTEIPVYALGLAAYAVSFSDKKGDFIGKKALAAQDSARKKILNKDFSGLNNLPRRIRPFALTGKGLAREGSRVFYQGRPAGWVTSGTMVPYWKTPGEGDQTVLTGEQGKRSIGLALLDSSIGNLDAVEIEIRERMVPALVVPGHLRTDSLPFCRSLIYDK